MPFDGTMRESERTRRLRAARALIDTEDKWLRGRLFDDSVEPTKFCALGALYHAKPKGKQDSVVALVARHATFRGYDNYNCCRVTGKTWAGGKIAGHNNMLGHAATMEMFDRAIAESVQLDLMVG